MVVMIGGLLQFGDSGMGPIFYRGLLCFFFFGVDGRLWVAGGGVRCV